ncbi:MAG: hypothetical protein ACLUGX_08150 [Methanobrevibacter smithii]|nr:hypothetical protein [Methanobrevibacter smithii]MEE0720117.1 hypothetical protein [Methanobrevibacter smithii]
MLIDDFNLIIEDKVDEIQRNVKLDLTKDINRDRYYHRNLFLKLMNFKHRTLYGKSYYIICSKELKQNLSKIPNEYVRNFHKILEIISSKGNLIPYQSRHIDSTSFDTLFNNYGINHAHLSSKLKNNSNFMEGSDYLLFFITYGDTVFLIDIDRHPKSDEWIDKKYAEIVYNNWPFIYESRRLRSVTDFNPKHNREDEYKLSKCVTLLKDIGGNAYIPFFSGIGSKGVPTQYVMFSDYLIKRIYKIEDELTNENNIKKLGFSCSKDCEFKLKLKNNKLYLLEQTRGECLDLGFPEIF